MVAKILAQCISEKSISGRKDSLTKHEVGDGKIAGVCSKNLKEAIVDGAGEAGMRGTGVRQGVGSGVQGRIIQDSGGCAAMTLSFTECHMESDRSVVSTGVVFTCGVENGGSLRDGRSRKTWWVALESPGWNIVAFQGRKGVPVKVGK